MEKIKDKNQPIWVVLITIGFILGILIGGLIMYVIEQEPSNEQIQAQTEYYENLLGLNDLQTDTYEGFFDQNYLREVLEIIDTRYIEDLDESRKEEYTRGLVRGLIFSLDDPFTRYLSPEEAQVYFEDRDPDFEGIGVVLEYDGQYTFVESVLQGFPAESVGLLAKDLIIEVDGLDIVGKLPGEVASLIRGEKGTTVDLKVLRIIDNVADELEFTIRRDTIVTENVSWEDIDETSVRINIIQFSDKSVFDFNSAWDSVVDEITAEKPNIENVVVDLRGNPGGFVVSVRHVMEDFFTEDTILFREQNNQGEIRNYTDNRTGSFENANVIVLVNEGSASASEIFSSAVQETDRGEIIGMPTVGKGVEQELVTLSDGGIIFLVFQKWLTSNGNEISPESPIEPDIQIDFTVEDLESGIDSQFDRALDELGILYSEED